MPRGTDSSWLAWNFPGFSTESPASWETPQSQANQDSWSPYLYPSGFQTLSFASHAQLLLPYGK